MGSHVYGAKRCEERERDGGKRLPAWQPLKQQGLPHIMEVVHGLVSVSDWRAEGGRGPRKRPSCLRARPQQERFKRRARFSHIIGGDSRAYEKMAENLVSSWWVEVSYLTSVYVDVEGWVSMIRNYEQQ